MLDFRNGATASLLLIRTVRCSSRMHQGIPGSRNPGPLDLLRAGKITYARFHILAKFG